MRRWPVRTTSLAIFRMLRFEIFVRPAIQLLTVDGHTLIARASGAFQWGPKR
jgi:hypothetical protein